MTPSKSGKKTTNWEKVFAYHVSDTGLGSRIYRQLSKLNPFFSSAAATMLRPTGEAKATLGRLYFMVSP